MRQHRIYAVGGRPHPLWPATLRRIPSTKVLGSGAPSDAGPLERTRYPGIYRRGSRYAVVTRHRGRQIKKSAPTLKAALGLQATLKADILRGEHRQSHTVTFAEYAREWVESYQGRTTRGFPEATRSEYRRSVEKAIPWFAEHCPKLSHAEPRDMRLYVAWLQKDGRSLSTVRNHFNVIRAMFATAVEDGLLRHNPCASVRASRVSTGRIVSPEVQRRALGEADIAALLGAAGEWRLFFEFMIHTGLQIGEALELQWADIEFGDRPRVKVRRQDPQGRHEYP